MPYIGKSPVGGGFHKLDNLTASATATYALTLGGAAYFPQTANQLLVSLNGVIQAPQDSFTVSGSNLIFDTALTASDSIDFVVALGDVLGVQGVTDGTVTTAKIGNGAVTDAKIANGAVTAAKLAAGVQGVAGISSSSTSGTALSIDANNIVTMPSVPSFHVYSPSPISAGNIITGYTVGHDTGSNFNASTGRFTCPVSGVYLFQATAGSSSSFGIDIRKNSNSIRRIELGNPHPFTWAGDSIIIDMSANDYAEVYCFLGSPAMSGSRAGFSGCLIG